MMEEHWKELKKSKIASSQFLPSEIDLDHPWCDGWFGEGWHGI